MVLDTAIAEKTAELLLQINAIKLNPKNPFTWASGWKSPIYCDNRIILSFPAIRNFVREHLAKQLEEFYGKPDVIAAVATGAIGIGMLVAEYLGLPFIYVRPEAKKHGSGKQIEGFLEKGQNVVVIEDLISTGKSSLNAIAAIKNAGATVKGMFAIFSYNFEIAITNFKKENITLHTLSNYNFLVAQGIKTHYISENELSILENWKTNPSEWNP